MHADAHRSCSRFTATPTSRAGSCRGRRGGSRETDACVVLPEYRGYDGLRRRRRRMRRRRSTRGPRSTSRATRLDVVADEHRLLRPLARHRDRRRACGAASAARARPAVAVLVGAGDGARACSCPGSRVFWRLISRVHFDTLARVRALARRCGSRTAIATSSFRSRMGREVFAAARDQGRAADRRRRGPQRCGRSRRARVLVVARARRRAASRAIGYSRRSSRKAIGTLIDSPSDVLPRLAPARARSGSCASATCSGVRPKRRARIDSRSM